jgi:hypothetical protein
MRADPEVSVVLVSYNMLPQLRRTLISLSPGYQISCPEGRCQLILIDNGSAVPPSPEDLAVPGLRIEFHHWPDAPPSPVAAVNYGISRARAPYIAVMIDGARMASPGLIDASLAACRLHPRPVVATYNYHLGSRPQQLAVREGYDEAAEAELLRSIDWPADGYRLFDIAVMELGKPWPGAMLETNALFMPRAMWEELDGYDPAFSGRGGGAANHDAFWRACNLPGAQLIKVGGEATFHQVHGGIATNAADDEMHRRIGIEFIRIRKRRMIPVRIPGWLFDSHTRALTTTV